MERAVLSLSRTRVAHIEDRQVIWALGAPDAAAIDGAPQDDRCCPSLNAQDGVRVVDVDLEVKLVCYAGT